ncbi:unnamed protein product [Brassica oleracea var. botrytis]|uniref:DUF4283 domain-containing protein n=2 Tax=Brassica TaxID=3705 RepID=A0A0D3CCC4_BRAOL|nr:unnamed protein product [Brassica napus]
MATDGEGDSSGENPSGGNPSGENLNGENPNGEFQYDGGEGLALKGNLKGADTNPKRSSEEGSSKSQLEGGELSGGDAGTGSKGKGSVGDSSQRAGATSPWTKRSHGDVQPEVEVVNGVASIQIPEEIFDESELLWKIYVVGYFIGDAPHVGPVHATVNCIWSSPKAGSKIDVQFIEKNTVLFRIDNSSMRDRVIQRKYWHIADVPLVVSVWSPESALHPPDHSAMPLWVDIKGVPNALYSHKGLKCLSRAIGGFVKLHPNTKHCVRLDAARVLIEVDLHKPLVEKISFRDQEGVQKELEVNFPWLPA